MNTLMSTNLNNNQLPNKGIARKSLRKKAAIASSMLLVFATGNVMAHNACDVDVHSGFSVDKTTIDFLDEEGQSLYKIMNDHELVIAGDSVALSSAQQALITDYATRIRATVPQMQSIAIEGVDLAIDGVNIAFNELLGEGNDVAVELTNELTSIRKDIDNKLSVDHGFTIGANGVVDGEFLGEDFEQRIESVVEKAVMSSMGSLLVALGQEMIFSGSDTKTFETKMERFGENIEQQMEARASKIKFQAQALCFSAVEIDHLEEKIKASIDTMPTFNVISTSQKHHGNDEQESEKFM